MTTNNELYSNLAIPPGKTIAENAEFLGVTLPELAVVLALPVESVHEIMAGDRAVTPDIAVALEVVLGVPAQLLLNLEARYRTTVARNWEKTGGKKEEWTDWCFGRLLRKHQHEDAADLAVV